MIAELDVVKISELDETSDFNDDDVVPVVQSSTTKKINKTNLIRAVKAKLGSAALSDAADFAPSSAIDQISTQVQAKSNEQNQRIDRIEYAVYLIRNNGVFKAYRTKALMIADSAIIPANSVVSVVNDSLNNPETNDINGEYHWDGAIFFKLPNNLLILANQYADVKASSAEENANNELRNTFGTTLNLFDATKIINGTYINIANNKISNAVGTAVAQIQIRPNQNYKIYSTTYPTTAWGIWYITGDAPDGIVNVVAHTVSSDGYIHFSIPSSTTKPLFLFLNVKIPSQSFDVTNQLLVLEDSESVSSITKIGTGIIRDDLLVSDIDQAIGLSRQSTNLLKSAIKLPNKYIRADDNKIRSTVGNSVDAIAFRLPVNTYYYFAPAATENHLVGSAQTIVYDTVVQLIVPILTEFAGVKKFTITEECYVFFTTRISSIDILPDFRISTSTDVKDGLVTKIAGTEIFARNGITSSESIDVQLSTSEKTGVYVTAANIEVRNNSSTKSRIAEVEPNTTYYFYSDFWNMDYLVIAFFENNPAVGAIGTEIQLQNTDVTNVKSFSVSNAGYCMFNTKIGTSMNIDSIFKIYKKFFSVINGSELADQYLRVKTQSNLENKKWLAIGDSITEHNFRTNLNYHDYLALSVDGLTVYNYGISGTGFFNRHNVADTITQTEVDFITIFLGTNDWGNQIVANRKQLGVFGDMGTTTISGCINTMLLALINKFPLIPITLITPLPRATNYGLNAADNAYGYNIKDLCDLLKQYAEHYSLPIYDLYTKSNLYPWQTASNQHYFTAPSNTEPDGLHPNDNGHKLIAKKLKSFLASIF